MSENEGYAGWENYETWAVALWIQNDEFMWHTISDVVQYSDDLPAAVKECIWSFYDDLELQGLFADLLTASLERVNWREIAAIFEEAQDAR